MRTRLILSIPALTLALYLCAQAPQRMSYQAVVRDDANALVTNTTVGMRLSILQGSASGTAVYVETHSAPTNANGLVTVQVGGGTVQSGTMEAIDWASGPFFLRSETDPDGGANYTISGTSQLLSVPYALYAANSEPGPQGPQGPAGPQGPGPCEVIRTGDGRVVLYNVSNAYGFGRNLTSGSNWYPRTLDGPVVAALASDSCVVLYTATTAYGFGWNSTSGSGWYVQTLNGPVLGSAQSSGRIVLYTAGAAYGFGYNSTGGSSWYPTTLTAAPLAHVVAGNRIVVYTATSAHGFGFQSTSGSSWYTTSLSAEPVGGIGTR